MRRRGVVVGQSAELKAAAVEVLRKRASMNREGGVGMGRLFTRATVALSAAALVIS